MKKIFYCIIPLGIIMLQSCQDQYTGALPPPPPVPCDNSFVTYTLQMKFDGADYTACPILNSPGVVSPPLATPYNFLTQQSYGVSTDPSSNPSPSNSFLCSIITENLQPSETPASPCILGPAGTIQSFWGTRTNTQQVQCFYNHATHIVIDYYDACVPCFYDGNANGSIVKALPHFIGTAGIPAHQNTQGQTLWPVYMTDDTYYQCKNCK